MEDCYSILPASRTEMREPLEAREPEDQEADQPGPTEIAEDGEHPACSLSIAPHVGDNLEHIREIKLVMLLSALTVSSNQCIIAINVELFVPPCLPAADRTCRLSSFSPCQTAPGGRQSCPVWSAGASPSSSSFYVLLSGTFK